MTLSRPAYCSTRTILLPCLQDVKIILAYPSSKVYYSAMDVKEMASLGGLARAKSLTGEQRRKIASKASKAAAKARRAKAKKKAG